MESRPSFTTTRVTITVAGTWYPLPAISVGEGCEIVIKSKKTNTGTISLAHDDTASKANPFSLDYPGDSASLRIKGSEQIVVTSDVAGDIVEVIAEK